MARFKAASFVRKISHGETIEELVDEAKMRTFVEQAEHMVLKIATGDRFLIKGGRDGITFVVKGTGDARTLHMRLRGRSIRVVRIYGHTHPRVTGPSQGDLDALAILNQKRSYIFEIGGDRRGTLIRPKAKQGP